MCSSDLEVTTIFGERGVLFDPDELPTRPDEHLSLYFGNSELESLASQVAPLEDPLDWNSLPTLHLEPPVPNLAQRSETREHLGSDPDSTVPRKRRDDLWWGLALSAIGLGLIGWGLARWPRPTKNSQRD